MYVSNSCFNFQLLRISEALLDFEFRYNKKQPALKLLHPKYLVFIQDVRVIYEHENMNQPQGVPLNIFV